MKYDEVINGVDELSINILLLSDLLGVSSMPKSNTARFHLIQAAEHLNHAGVTISKAQKQDADNRTLSNE